MARNSLLSKTELIPPETTLKTWKLRALDPHEYMCYQKSLIIPTISVDLLDLKINALYNSIYALLEFQQWLLTAKITCREKDKSLIIIIS